MNDILRAYLQGACPIDNSQDYYFEYEDFNKGGLVFYQYDPTGGAVATVDSKNDSLVDFQDIAKIDVGVLGFDFTRAVPPSVLYMAMVGDNAGASHQYGFDFSDKLRIAHSPVYSPGVQGEYIFAAQIYLAMGTGNPGSTLTQWKAKMSIGIGSGTHQAPLNDATDLWVPGGDRGGAAFQWISTALPDGLVFNSVESGVDVVNTLPITVSGEVGLVGGAQQPISGFGTYKPYLLAIKCRYKGAVGGDCSTEAYINGEKIYDVAGKCPGTKFTQEGSVYPNICLVNDGTDPDKPVLLVDWICTARTR